jgi:O-antigen ligase
MAMADMAGWPQRDPKPTPWRVLLGFLRDPFVAAMFFSLLLIGADRLGIRLAGLNLRVTFPALMAAFGLLYLQRQTDIAIPTSLSVLFFLLAIAGAVSTINSLVATKSIGYTIWVFFNFFVIIVLGYNLARMHAAEKVLSLWFMIFRIHVVLVLLDTALNIARGDFERSYLWFYEPSYMAIFLTAYFGSSLYMLLHVGRPYALDFGLATLVILFTASATGMFGIIFALLLNFLLARQRLKLFLWSAGLGSLFIAILFLFFSETLYFKLIVGFFMEGGSVLDLILNRAGNRWVRVIVGWEAFLHSPWTGVGIGGDAAYMDAKPLPDASYAYYQPWLDISGQPFCNIFVEVLGTMGIVGFVPFIAILGYCVWQAAKLMRSDHPLAPIAMAFLVGFFCSILAMQLEGTMLRYYLWSPLGLAFGVLAQIRGLAPSSPEHGPQMPMAGRATP